VGFEPTRHASSQRSAHTVPQTGPIDRSGKPPPRQEPLYRVDQRRNDPRTRVAADAGGRTSGRATPAPREAVIVLGGWPGRVKGVSGIADATA
jgi:hypothetical protein